MKHINGKRARSKVAANGSQGHSTTGETLCSAQICLPWLDTQTAAEVDAIVKALALRQPNVLAVIVYGSVARHTERPLTDPEPSDLDLLVVVTPGLPEKTAVAIHDTMGRAGQPFGYTPRTIEPLLVEADLVGWDAAFVANILHDGVLLWAREPLPAPFNAISVGTADTAGTAHEGVAHATL